MDLPVSLRTVTKRSSGASLLKQQGTHMGIDQPLLFGRETVVTATGESRVATGREDRAGGMLPSE